MPPLHVKLGLIKQFVKQLDTEGEAFKHIQQLFPKLSEAKIKAGVYMGPEVKRLINSIDFPELLSEVERTAWMSFVYVVIMSFWANTEQKTSGNLLMGLWKHKGKWAAGCH